MALVYGRAGRLTAKKRGFSARAEGRDLTEAIWYDAKVEGVARARGGWRYALLYSDGLSDSNVAPALIRSAVFVAARATVRTYPVMGREPASAFKAFSRYKRPGAPNRGAPMRRIARAPLKCAWLRWRSAGPTIDLKTGRNVQPPRQWESKQAADRAAQVPRRPRRIGPRHAPARALTRRAGQGVGRALGGRPLRRFGAEEGGQALAAWRQHPGGEEETGRVLGRRRHVRRAGGHGAGRAAGRVGAAGQARPAGCGAARCSI
jgi:hypothetical protein